MNQFENIHENGPLFTRLSSRGVLRSEQNEMAPSSQGHTFSHLQKQSGALVNGGSKIPKKSFCTGSNVSKVDFSEKVGGVTRPSLARNKGIA